MKILVISPAPPNRFHRIRLTNILAALSTDHQIKGIYLNVGNSIKSSADYQIISKSRWKSVVDCALKLSLPQPLEISYCHSPKISEKVSKIAKEFDLILVKRLRAAQYVSSNINTPVILDSTDAMSLYYEKLKSGGSLIKKPLYWEEWIKYLLYERALAQRFKNWIVCSKPDANYLRTVLPKNVKIFIVPNVVDTKYYSSRTEPSKNTLLFSGLLEKEVNQNAILFFLDQVFPIIKKAIPEVKLNIVGPNPPAKLKSYHNKSVNIEGAVPDIRKHIEKATCVVVPTLDATGTRNKILQAWSHARPVVSTSAGARGLKAINGKNILVADNPNDFANAVLQIISNQKFSKKLGKNARKHTIANYNLNILRDEYNQVINKVLSKK